MELVKRYSKPEYQGSQLRRMVELVERSMKTQVRRPSPLPSIQRVERRLPAESIAELVQAYRDGVSTPELRQRYRLGQGSVIRILHGHGVAMRNQGLAGDDVSLAAELYCSGATLAELGERFGISPNAVRRALVTAGVVMRARGRIRPRS